MELVTIKNNQVVTSTLLVAEKFGKVHSSVLRSLDNLVKQNCLTKNMFMEQSREYRGRTFRYYLMNRDGFALLVMGFTGTKALEWKLKYIQAFNEMEKTLSSPAEVPALPDFSSPALAARAWADEYEARLSAEKKIEEDKHKVLFAESVKASETDIPIATLAKVLAQNGVDIGRNRLLAWMRDNGYLMKTGRNWNQPRQVYVDAGLFRVTESVRDNGYGYTPSIYITTYLTGKGQMFFLEKFLGPKELELVEV